MMANPFQGDDVDPFSGARDEEGNVKTESKSESAGEPLKMASFKEAFREARNRGDKTFEYMGKKYTTEMAGERRPSSSGSGRSASGKSESMDRASVAARKPGIIAKLAEMARNPDNPRLRRERAEMGMKKGGKVKKMAAGGSVSKRADGCAQRGKTRGKMV